MKGRLTWSVIQLNVQQQLFCRSKVNKSLNFNENSHLINTIKSIWKTHTQKIKLALDHFNPSASTGVSDTVPSNIKEALRFQSPQNPNILQGLECLE